MNPFTNRAMFLDLSIFDGAPNTNVTTDTGLTPGMVTFHSRNLIRLAKPNLVHDVGAVVENVPRNGGNVIQFRRDEPFEKALTPIVEGVLPAGHKIRQTEISTSIHQFGDYVSISDRVEAEHLDKMVAEANALNADQAGRTLDTISREVQNGGTNKILVPSVATNGTVTEVLLRKDITGNCVIRLKDISNAVTKLKRVNAPKYEGSYLGIIHPDVEGDIRNNALFQDWQKYTTSDKLFAGEIGMLHGVRFLLSSEAKIFAPNVISDGVCRLTNTTTISESTTTVYVDEVLTPATPATAIGVYINGTANTITKIEANGGSGSKLTIGTAITALAQGGMICGQGAGKLGHAVYSVLVKGAKAYGTTSVEGEGLEFIFKNKAQAGGALNLRSTSGWKACKAGTRLVEAYMVRIECTSAEFGLTAVAN